jgi:hypothetical protein
MADDDPFYSPTHRPPVRQPQPAEPLCEFMRAPDGPPMAIDLRFHGESYGWEALISSSAANCYIPAAIRHEGACCAIC